ncbi:MAG: OmpA family protein [Alphaproteobacteria bacterium]|nr:OmpA family protein [Alphaproteobacteria bacterium]
MSSLIPQKKHEECEDWLTTYSDMVTLLLTFFVLLVSISKIDANQYENVKAGIKKGISNVEVERPLDGLKKDLQSMLSQTGMEGVEEASSLTTDADGVVLELPSSLFYASGEATVGEAAKPVLDKLAATLLGERYLGFQVEVQGHTDDAPIATVQFPSNWELSAARATGVIRQLIVGGIPSDRLKAVGMADVAPKVANRDLNGNPLPENREVNRRIIVRIYPR